MKPRPSSFRLLLSACLKRHQDVPGQPRAIICPAWPWLSLGRPYYYTCLKYFPREKFKNALLGYMSRCKRGMVKGFTAINGYMEQILTLQSYRIKKWPNTFGQNQFQSEQAFKELSRLPQSLYLQSSSNHSICWQHLLLVSQVGRVGKMAAIPADSREELGHSLNSSAGNHSLTCKDRQPFIVTNYTYIDFSYQLILHACLCNVGGGWIS